jgi:hypothetical protein
MKKLLLASLVMFCAGLLNAQSIDILVDGAAFSMTSPNGVYIAGNMEMQQFTIIQTQKKLQC